MKREVRICSQPTCFLGWNQLPHFHLIVCQPSCQGQSLGPGSSDSYQHFQHHLASPRGLQLPVHCHDLGKCLVSPRPCDYTALCNLCAYIVEWLYKTLYTCSKAPSKASPTHSAISFHHFLFRSRLPPTPLFSTPLNKLPRGLLYIVVHSYRCLSTTLTIQAQSSRDN